MKLKTVAAGLFTLSMMLVMGCSSQSQKPWGTAQDYAAQRNADQNSYAWQCFGPGDPYCYDPGPREVVIVEERRGFDAGPIGGPGAGSLEMPRLHLGR